MGKRAPQSPSPRVRSKRVQSVDIMSPLNLDTLEDPGNEKSRSKSRFAGSLLDARAVPILPMGRRWPLYSDDSGKIQFTENVNGGNAYRSKSIPFSRKEKQAPSRAAMESIGICVPSIMSRRFSLQRNFRTIPLVVLYAPPAFRLSC